MNSKYLAVRNQALDIDIVLLFIRILVGVAFIFHGWGKIQSPLSWMGPQAQVPAVLQALAALAEFCGGIGLVLGFLTRLSSVGLLCTMIVAVFFHGVIMGHPFVSAAGGGSYELAAIYLAISTLIFISGPGRYSVDSKIFGIYKI